MFRIEYNDQVKRKIKLVSNNVEFALFPSNVKATKKKKNKKKKDLQETS